MIDDLGLKGSQYNIAVSLFYITYILAEFPASIFVKRLQFKRVMPVICFGWGIVCMVRIRQLVSSSSSMLIRQCIGFVQGFASLVVLRLMLGFFEGCLFPALTLFLANWYKREELGLRISYLFGISSRNQSTQTESNIVNSGIGSLWRFRGTHCPRYIVHEWNSGNGRVAMVR
jgi:sugar phosphate permease